MKQTILFAALLLALSATAIAQQKEAPACTVRILLQQQNWDNPEQTRERMTPDQTKWWLEDGQKKFKNFCFVSASQPYDYRIVWADSETHQAGFIPTTTTTEGTVTSGNKTGSYSETSTTNNGREVTYVTTYVQIRLLKADAQVGCAPLFNELHKGKWIWSKPDRAALENALKALSKLTKSSR